LFRVFANIVIILGLILVTFFGIGPVLLADGSTTERMITLVIVLIIYAVLIFMLVRLGKNKSTKE
jgi:hypothetical protein